MAVTLRILCPDWYQPQTKWMTLTGRVVWNPHCTKTQVIPLETAVMVSLVNSFNKLSSSQKGHIVISLSFVNNLHWL